MNSDQVKGEWKVLKGKFKEKWGKLTDDELTESKGDLEQIAGTIQKKYGDSKEQAKDDINAYVKTLKF